MWELLRVGSYYSCLGEWLELMAFLWFSQVSKLKSPMPQKAALFIIKDIALA
jgi:hypothetical protein